VRKDFFSIAKKEPGSKLIVLITGGSRGSHRLNTAAQSAWPMFQRSQLAVRWIHQTGAQDFEETAAVFQQCRCEGQVIPFLENMPQVFAQCDLIICRAGAGAVAELAAAGKPSVLVPFPFAADQHQLHNAEAMSKAGAARLILDHELTGEELFNIIQSFAN